MLEFFTDPRVIVPIVIAFCGFVAQWSAFRKDVSSLARKGEANCQEIKSIREKDIAGVISDISDLKDEHVKHAVALAELKSGHESQGKRLDEWVDELKRVVRNLQDVAIKLASGGNVHRDS